MKKSRLIIHFGYILLIAAIVIIYLITTKFGSNDELVKYLGFGLTITSLFVGLFAIAQAFFSGNSLSNTVSLLDKSARDMVKVNHEVSAVIQTLQDRVDQIPTHLNDFREELSSTLLSANIGKNGSEQINKKGQPTQIQIDEFLKSSSLNGLYSMYIVTQSSQKQKAFDLEKILSESHISSLYSLGYIVAAKSMGLFNIKETSKGTYLASGILLQDEEVREYLVKKINMAEYEHVKADLIILLNKIESFFLL